MAGRSAEGTPGPGAQLSLFSSMKASATRSSPPIPARADPVPRGPPQDPGQSRGQDPLREEHRPGAPAVPGLRGQYGSRISRWNGQSRRGRPSFGPRTAHSHGSDLKSVPLNENETS